MRKYTLFILFLVASKVYSQTYNFRNFNTDDGLPQGYIYDISQDGHSNLMLSTSEGLSVFNGNKFITYDVKKGLAENFVTTHFVDSKERLWLGHFQGGVTICDSLKFKQLKSEELLNIRINRIKEDRQKNIWIATFGKGIFIADQNGKIHHLKDLQSDNITDVFFSGTKEVIIATYEGLHVYDYSASSFSVKFKQEIELLTDVKVNKILEAKDGKSVWVTTDHEGIALLSKQDDKYTVVLRIKEELYLKSGIISSATLDRSNNLWIGTFGEGIKKISFSEKDIKKYSAISFSSKNGLNNEYIQSIYCDYEDNIWIGTYGGGLIQLVDEKFALYNVSSGLAGDKIFAITKDSLNNFWFGNEKGLNKYTPGINFSSIQYDEKNGFVNDKVTTLYNYNDKELWVGTEGSGVFIYDFEHQKFTDIAEKYKEKIHITNFITANKQGDIYIATTEGLFIYNRQSDSFSSLTTADGLLHNNIFHVFIDKKSRVWLASHGAGLYYYAEGKVKLYKDIPNLKSFSINSITEDGTGNIWFATEGDGVFYFDGRSFLNYNYTNGLASNYCYSIISDNKDNIWVGHKNGVSYKKNYQVDFKKYNKTNGFISPETNLNAVYRDEQKGNIWIGTSQGAMIYLKDKDVVNFREPSTSIVSITVNNDTVETTSGHLELPYKKYSIKFDFIGVSLIHPEKVRYRYILDGFETDWNESDNLAHIASYPKLEDGEYVFNVMACNSDGVWNKEPVIFSFTINKPYWKKAWFYSLVFVVFMAGAFLVFRIRTRALRIAKKKLEEMVNEKTVQLKVEKANVEESKAIIERKNRDITDSINYAKRIQEAILPSKEKIQQKLHSFIYYKPRDIVSGDFYWFSEIDNKIIICAFDCTGHGVPGAFMSLIGSTLLNKIVNNYSETLPSVILTELNANIIELLKQEFDESSSNDGMDISLCTIDFDKKEVVYSGAARPLYFVRNKELDEIKGSLFSIGGFQEGTIKVYNDHVISFQDGDMIYMCSDGYADQFGGPLMKKFMTKKLKDMFISISHLDLREQYKIIKSTFEEWKGRNDQVDDVLVVGVRF